jgi:NADPH-dependent 2,4-dienoyl-CoA reductase/sulfur reductase-like enzyme
LDRRGAGFNHKITWGAGSKLPTPRNVQIPDNSLTSSTNSLLSSQLSPLLPTNLPISIMSQVIVVGGGLAGLSAAHTVLERGGNVLLLDKQGYVHQLFFL